MKSGLKRKPKQNSWFVDLPHVLSLCVVFYADKKSHHTKAAFWASKYLKILYAKYRDHYSIMVVKYWVLPNWLPNYWIKLNMIDINNGDWWNYFYVFDWKIYKYVVAKDV